MMTVAASSWSSWSIWLPVAAAVCSAVFTLLLRREVRLAQQFCLVAGLIAALALAAAPNGSNAMPASLQLPSAVAGCILKFRITGASVTIMIFILISFLFSLSWLISARPGGKSLFWLALLFASAWATAAAADLQTLFICAQSMILPQYFLNLASGVAHNRRVARRMLIAGLFNDSLILAAALFMGVPHDGHAAAAGAYAPAAAFCCIMLAVWISLSLFPFHGVQNARITLDGRNLLPLNSNLWIGLVLMVWILHSALRPQLHALTWPLSILATVAMAACSAACFAQRELSRSMAYAAGAVSALAFLAWLSQSTIGIVGAFLILGVLPVTIFGFQRGIDLLFLHTHDPSFSTAGNSPTSGGATHMLFLLLTAACIGMPATAVFRGVWFGLLGMIRAAMQYGEFDIQTVIFGTCALASLIPMILGVISRSLLAFRNPVENIRRPDLIAYSGTFNVLSKPELTEPLSLNAYIRAARRWAVIAMLVSLVLGIFPNLATGPLRDTLQRRTVTPPPPPLRRLLLPPFHEALVNDCRTLHSPAEKSTIIFLNFPDSRVDRRPPTFERGLL